MKESEELLFKNVLESFYQQATKNHTIKYALKNKLKALFNKVRKDWLLIPETERHSTISKTCSSLTKNENPILQFASLRLTAKDKKENNLSVSRSRSRWSKSSSKDLSQNESKYFNCEWIYQSGEKSRTLLFAIMSALITTDNKFTFKYYQDKINDELAEADNFSELELGIIGNYWQKMGGLLARSKTIRWQKLLKEAIDKFPAKFTEMACRIILQLQLKEESFSHEVIDKMSKQLKIQTVLFTISYRDIQHITKLGKQGPELCIGQLSHSKMYVVSNKTPQYSAEQLNNRAIRNTFNVVATTLLKEFNAQTFSEYKELAQNKNEKENLAREHFKGKLVGLQEE